MNDNDLTMFDNDIELNQQEPTKKVEKKIAKIKEEIQQVSLLDDKPEKIKDVLQKNTKTNDIIKNILRENIDYGIIPGTNTHTLYQSGASVLKRAFGISTKFELVRDIFKTEPGKELFYQEYKCKAYYNGIFLDEAVASCNSKEPGKGGPNIYSKLNTITQIAQKRAFVRVIRTILGITGLFTQDIEELPVDEQKAGEKRVKETFINAYNYLRAVKEFRDLPKKERFAYLQKHILIPNSITINIRQWTIGECNLIDKLINDFVEKNGD